MLIDFCGVRGIRFTYKYINYRFGGAESYMRKNGTKRAAGKRIAGAIICAGILLLAAACGRANESDPDVVNVIPEPISETPVLAPEITEDPTPSAEPAVDNTETGGDKKPSPTFIEIVIPTQAVTPTPDEPVITRAAEDKTIQKVGVFDIHDLYEQYGKDDYQLFTSDEKTKAEKNYGSFYINGEWVYSAKDRASAYFWIVDMDLSDDEEEILIIEQEAFSDDEKSGLFRQTAAIIDKTELNKAVRFTVTIFDKNGALLFNDTVYALSGKHYVSILGDGKMTLSAANIDLPPEGYTAQNVTFITENDNNTVIKSFKPEQSVFDCETSMGYQPRFYTVNAFMAHSVDDNGMVEISPQIITLISVSSERIDFTAGEKAYWADVYYDNSEKKWFTGDAYDLSCWLEEAPDCPEKISNFQGEVELPEIRCEKDVLPLAKFIYAFHEIDIVNPDSMAAGRKSIWESLIKQEAGLILTTLPDTDEELLMIEKSGLQFEIRPVIDLTGCNYPLNGIVWYRHSMYWNFTEDNNDYSSYIYAVIRSDMPAQTSARKLFDWLGPDRVVKHIKGNAYIGGESEIYEGVTDLTVIDPAPYAFDDGERQKFLGTYYFEGTNIVPGAVNPEDYYSVIKEEAPGEVSYKSGYWEDWEGKVRDNYTFFSYSILKLGFGSSERYKVLEPAIESINGRMAEHWEEICEYARIYCEELSKQEYDYRTRESTRVPYVTVYRADEKVFNAVLNNTFYCPAQCGAQEVFANYGCESFNFDADSGKRIDFSEVCRDSHRFAEILAAKFVSDYPDEIFDCLEEKLAEQIADNRLVWLLMHENITVRIYGNDIGKDKNTYFEASVLTGEYPELFVGDWFSTRYMVAVGEGETLEYYDSDSGKSHSLRIDEVLDEGKTYYGRYYLTIDDECYDTKLTWMDDDWGVWYYYFVRIGNEVYLYTQCWENDDDFDLVIFHVNEGREPDKLLGLGQYCFDSKIANINNFYLESRQYILGTRWSDKRYTISDDGIPVTSEKYFPACGELTLLHNCRFSVLDPETDEIIGVKILLKGEKIEAEQTDGYKFIDFSTEDGTMIRLDSLQPDGWAYSSEWSKIFSGICNAD